MDKDNNKIKIHNGILHKIRNYLLAGIVVASPIAITLYLAWAIVDTIDEYIKPLIPDRYNPDNYLPFSLPGLGLILLVIALTLLGFITANFFGKAFIRLGERWLNRMPVIRSIYNTVKQIFETILSQNPNSLKDVVLVQYPRPNMWAIAFVSGDNKGEIQSKLSHDIVNIFLPTTPNPTSGYLLFVPREDLIYLDMSVDQGIKYVISAGLVDPTELPLKSEEDKAKLNTSYSHNTE